MVYLDSGYCFWKIIDNSNKRLNRDSFKKTSTILLHFAVITAKNTVILPYFLVWKLCFRKFPQSFGKIVEN